MTIKESLEQIDSLLENEISTDQKIKWLSETDLYITQEIHRNRKVVGEKPFEGYGPCVDQNTKLLVPEPYSALYRWRLEQEISDTTGEIARMNNAAVKYGRALQEYANHVTRTYDQIKVAQPVWW